MKKAQVLIVEDDGIIAMDIESQLKQLGYGVTAVVGYGEEAIEKVKENAKRKTSKKLTGSNQVTYSFMAN